MKKPRGTADDFLTISPRIRVLPIIHGSGDFAIRVREELLGRPYDCVAVPLPPSFQDDVEAAIEQLPTISVVAQLDADRDGWRVRVQLRAHRSLPGRDCGVAYGGRRTDRPRVHRPGDASFRGDHRRFPRPVRAQASVPRALFGCGAAGHPASSPGQNSADRLDGPPPARARTHHRPILLVCSLLDWPWIRDAYRQHLDSHEPESFFAPMASFTVDPRTLIFALGELPFITGLYERGRARAHCRRQPVGRRTQGAGARGAGESEREASQDRRNRLLLRCWRSISVTFATFP